MTPVSNGLGYTERNIATLLNCVFVRLQVKPKSSLLPSSTVLSFYEISVLYNVSTSTSVV